MQGYNPGVGQGDHCLKDQIRKNLLPDSFVWLLTSLSSLKTISLRTSVFNWLLVGGLPQFLATWALPIWRTAYNMAACFVRVGKLEEENKECVRNMETTVLI